jgi:hypothetical protein
MNSQNGYFISGFSSMTLVNSFNQEKWAPWWWRNTGAETCRSGYNIINKYIQSLMYLIGFNSFKPVYIFTFCRFYWYLDLVHLSRLSLMILYPILTLKIFIFLLAFASNPVSNIGSHNTRYELIVYFTYVFWSEDGLIKTKSCYNSKIPILSFWHRNLAFKFLHTLYVKCE